MSAVRFVRVVLGDFNRAEEIEDKFLDILARAALTRHLKQILRAMCAQFFVSLQGFTPRVLVQVVSDFFLQADLEGCSF
jgi:hypothetical protein